MHKKVMDPDLISFIESWFKFNYKFHKEIGETSYWWDLKMNFGSITSHAAFWVKVKNDYLELARTFLKMSFPKYVGIWRWESEQKARKMNRVPVNVTRYKSRRSPERMKWSSALTSMKTPRGDNLNTCLIYLSHEYKITARKEKRQHPINIEMWLLLISGAWVNEVQPFNKIKRLSVLLIYFRKIDY